MNQQDFQQIRKHLYRGELAVALRQMQPLLDALRNPKLHERQQQLLHDYQLIIDYLRQGVNDPQRDELYARLLRKCDALVYNIETHTAIRDLRSFADAYSRLGNHPIDMEQIKPKLEQFVGNVALLDFESEENHDKLSAQIYQEHHEWISTVFDAIWISETWGKGDEDYCSELILSPTIDINDALLLTSAITLSLFFHFDLRKSETLLRVCQETTDVALRQRAFVGWALTLPANSQLYPQVKSMVSTFCENAQHVSELIELQMQIYLCMNAENDHAEIQRDIMPNIINHSNLKITRFGIEEKDDDPLEDILHPEAADHAMEAVEQSFQKMLDMQKAGADIYFGGFSQMKRFPFFYRTSNWFEPFYVNHPELRSSVEKLKGSQLMRHIFESGQFCDSDKYSFVLAMKSVIDRIPDNMREMIDSEDMLGAVMTPEEMLTPVYKRRMYLQDLYRFFRLSDAKAGLRNPFSSPDDENKNGVGELFLANKLFLHTAVGSQLVTLCSFLAKRKLFQPLQRLLDAYQDVDDIHLLYYRGFAAHQSQDYPLAKKLYQQILQQQPEHKKALQGFAKACYFDGDYAEAAGAYEQLLAIAPDHIPTQKKYCICLINTGRTEEAAKRLYQLDFEKPGDWDVVRILAWTLLVGGKQAQAQTEYRRLLASGKKRAEDVLNAALCVWAGGNIAEAVTMLSEYQKSSTTGKKLLAELLKEKEMLSTYGISVYQIIMMADAIGS